MAHKILVDGTNFGITGGKNLIDGTEYSISGGKTLVDGTEYDILFEPPYEGSVSIEITDSDSNNVCHVTIGATRYEDIQNSYIGVYSTTNAVIVFGVSGFASWIKIDGEYLAQSSPGEYNWTIPYGVQKISISMSSSTFGGGTHGFIEVITS